VSGYGCVRSASAQSCLQPPHAPAGRQQWAGALCLHLMARAIGVAMAARYGGFISCKPVWSMWWCWSP